MFPKFWQMSMIPKCSLDTNIDICHLYHISSIVHTKWLNIRFCFSCNCTINCNLFSMFNHSCNEAAQSFLTLKNDTKIKNSFPFISPMSEYLFTSDTPIMIMATFVYLSCYKEKNRVCCVLNYNKLLKPRML